MPFKKILVPMDFSEHALHALRLAISLARSSGGSITLLHVGVVPHVYATELGLAGAASPLFAQMSEDIAKEQRHHLERVASEEIPAGLSHDVALREGFPPEEVLSQVKDGGYDLVVMGTHGRTGLGRVLLGSVTERVVRECPVPVMVTR